MELLGFLLWNFREKLPLSKVCKLGTASKLVVASAVRYLLTIALGTRGRIKLLLASRGLPVFIQRINTTTHQQEGRFFKLDNANTYCYFAGYYVVEWRDAGKANVLSLG